jgi:pyridinium-3,5-bisthiocarboxylic acid mononucleotide nickel chelatase
MSPEIFSYLYEKLIKEGVLDVYTESIYMKKNRPAIKLSVLCNKEDLERFIEIILMETSTFGVRYHKYNRKTLLRKFEKLNCEYGDVTIKIGYYKNKIIKVTPEYEECKIIARDANISIKNVYDSINCSIKNKFMQKC